MFVGFIYEWTDKKTGLKYIGRHEGTIDDGYIGSGTKFIVAYRKRPEDFSREILYEINTSIEELISKEEECLSNIHDDHLYYGIDRKYYNQVRNSSGYTSTNNPMKNPEMVAQMLETRTVKGSHKNPWVRTIEKYGYEGARAIKSKNALGNTHGMGNKGKPKSDEHKRNIAKNRKGGRPLADPTETMNLYLNHGINKSAEIVGIPISTFRSRVITAKRNTGNQL